MTTLVRNLLTQMIAAKDSMAGLQKKRGYIDSLEKIGHIGFTGDILIIIELCIYVCSWFKFFN